MGCYLLTDSTADLTNLQRSLKKIGYSNRNLDGWKFEKNSKDSENLSFRKNDDGIMDSMKSEGNSGSCSNLLSLPSNRNRLCIIINEKEFSSRKVLF